MVSNGQIAQNGTSTTKCSFWQTMRSPAFSSSAICPLLKLVSNSSDQEVAGEPHRRRHPMKPPPLTSQLEDGQLQEPRERLCDIDRCFVHVSERAAFRCGSGERSRWASRTLAKSRAS